MAVTTERWFTGFEDGAAGDCSSVSTPIVAGKVYPARTGSFYATVMKPANGASVYQCRRPLVNSFTCTNDLDMVVARMQLAVRIRQYPNAANSQLFGYSLNSSVSPQQDCGVRINTNGTLGLINNNQSVENGNYVLQLDTWYVLRLHWQYQRINAGADPYRAVLDIYEGDSMDTIPTLLGSVVSAGSASMSNFNMAGIPCLGQNSAGATRIIDYDDWWLSIASGTVAEIDELYRPDDYTGRTIYALDWPAGSRIAPVPVTSQVSTGWTGVYQLVQDVPNSGVSGNEQTVAASGAASIFGHDEAYDLGLIPGFTGGGSLPYQLQRSSILAAPTIEVFTRASGGTISAPMWVFATQVAYDGTGTKESAPSAKILVDATSLPAIYIGITSTTWSPYAGLFRVYITNAYSERGVFDPITNANGLCATLDRAPFTARFLETTTPWPGTVIPGLVPTPAAPFPQFVGIWTDVTAQGQLFYPYQGEVDGESTAVAAGAKVYASAKRTAGSDTLDLIINNTTVAVASITTTYGTDSGFEWLDYDEDQFNAGLEFGVLTTNADATQLGNCLMEVITGGPARACVGLGGQYQQQCGIYTSNAGFQAITVGFEPTFVMVKRIGTTATAGAIKMDWMGGTTSWVIGAVTPESIGIMQLTASGFIVGPANSANGAAAVYAYVAIRDGQQDVVNGAYLVTGEYLSGTNSDALATVPIPYPSGLVDSWTPDTLFLLGNGFMMEASPEIAAGSVMPWSTGGSLLTDAVTALGDGSFTIGANSAVLAAGQYPYAAFRHDVAGLLSTAFETGSYAGTGAQQDVSVPFTPEFVAVDHLTGAYSGRWRSNSGNTGTNSVPWPGGAVTTVDIIAIAANQFTAGTGASVVGQTEYWFAFVLAAAFGNTGSTNTTDPGGGDYYPPLPPYEPIGTLPPGGGLLMPPGTIGGRGCTND